MVKVAPAQCALLGLDVMWSLNMVLFTTDLAFEITPTPVPRRGFRFLNYAALMATEGITESELVPVASLPPPREAYRAMVAAGRTNNVVDLSYSCFSVPQLPHKSLVNLGTSCFTVTE